MEEMMVDGNSAIRWISLKIAEYWLMMPKRQEIESEIIELEGFDVFRICILEDIKPIYKETLTEFGISRWLEVPLTLK